MTNKEMTARLAAIQEDKTADTLDDMLSEDVLDMLNDGSLGLER